METHLNLTSKQSKQNVSKVKTLFLLLTAAALFWGGVRPGFAVTEYTIADGLDKPMGIALDEQNSYLYFVEYGSGKLKRIHLSPGMTASPETIAGGFWGPVDVALDVEGGAAYVTAEYFKSSPGSSTKIGALWKVDILNPDPDSPVSKKLVTFNMGKTKQLVLNPQKNQAYTVPANGKLIRIDLTTGARIPVYRNLTGPVGIAITKDGQYAYVTENSPSQISKIDLTLGAKVGKLELGESDELHGLAWADSSENSLLMIARGSSSNDYKILRVDLLTSEKHEVLTGFNQGLSGIASVEQGTSIYAAAGNSLKRYKLVDFDGPVFMGVGNVPASEINKEGNYIGYATPGDDNFPAENAPFGGTLDIRANLYGFNKAGATHYAVLVQKDGGPYEALNRSWRTYRWNTGTRKYEPVTVAPDTAASGEVGKPVYEIPLTDGEYRPDYWSHPFLFMRWPSGENGLYTFTIELYNSRDNWRPIPLSELSGDSSEHELPIRVDNTPPTVKINEIWQCSSADPVKTCEIVNEGDSKFYFNITAYDANQHLRSYTLKAVWGSTSANIISGSGNSDAWEGIVNKDVRNPGYWEAECNCAHTFYLTVWKRTINGYTYIYRRSHHKSITINNTNQSCAH